MALTLIQRIYKHKDEFSKGYRKLAAAITTDNRNPSFNITRIVNLTAAELGKYVNVSESTVVRFARLLEYDGYKDFQRGLLEYANSKVTPTERIEITNSKIGRESIAVSVMKEDINNILHTLNALNKPDFDEVIDALLGANNLYIAGARNSEPLARLFEYNLSLIFDNVKLVTPTATSEIFEQMIPIKSGDAIFVISFPRYSTMIVNAAKYAKAKGAKVIVLTDKDTSPLIEFADFYLTAQAGFASFMDSLVAPLSIINAIVVAITRKRELQVKNRMTELKKLYDKYGVYTDN